MTKISEQIIGAAIKIHKTLGPGLLENVYQGCLAYELTKLGINSAKEVTLPVQYEEMTFETGYRADLIVDKKILVEIKRTTCKRRYTSFCKWGECQ